VIRVVLAEDHAVVRAGIQRLLAATDDISVVGLAADGNEAIDLVRECEPDVVVMDLSMPNLDGIAATRVITNDHEEVRVLVLTSHSDRDRILDAFDAGATGYFLKDADPEDLAKAVRSAARGETPVDPRAASVLLARREAARPATDLTDREMDVLVLVAEGLPNKLIARKLGISEKTVKTHLTHVFQRIGVSDRTQAALWAHRVGLVRRTDRARIEDG
jgi:DNA-binding NarL/FixJ family response regulator